MLNKVILMGRITADPELKHTPSNVAVCSFSLAVNRRFNRNETDFIDIVAWRQQAEFISKYFTKGQQMVVCGALQTRTWEDKNGNKRKSVEVVVDEVHFADSKRTAGNTSPRDEALPFDFSAGNAFSEIEDEDDGNLPF
ncbi:MAG: single-stranded DNA-binding protein [Clostridia bacterium]|nr:single-stranded DNA-binding protein [Clostridia bacterium]MBQ6867699.1 single-stranded DNA-binding protein [Clostridia bacterium]MBQ6934072.1 single-stranded DNA-binding protein [Clostridia bacterium]MBQ7087110.1 single-stranded DNA-binding protein [Clostridia bacterium]MBQ7092969.1 single-stranded DNA-binding protein [Clostridia bacterium]